MAVLLIGSTGNGKSTLGNYLLDPDSHKPGGSFFKVAKNNLPQTQHSKGLILTVKINGADTKLGIIDTPGLNESKVSDLSHMIELINTLQQIQFIRACIFVVKFNSKIDQQYKDTIAYYSKLLPSLFDNNIVIVVTDYATDERSEGMRKRQGIDYKEITTNIKTHIKMASGISFSPILFSIDCLPWDAKEQEKSKSVREAILSYVFSLKEIDVQNLQVAKTKSLIEDDEKLIKEYEGQITGYNMRLQQANEHAKEALDRTQKKEKDITKIDSELVQLKDSLNEKDSDDLVSVGAWSCDDSWKFFQWQSKRFNIVSEWDYSNVSTWTNGNCEIKDLEQKKREVRGMIQGHFMRGLYANVTLETSKKVKHLVEIVKLKRDIELKEKEHRMAMEHAEQDRNMFQQFKEEIDLLHGFISDRRMKIKEHASTTLSLEQARLRLEKLTQQKD